MTIRSATVLVAVGVFVSPAIGQSTSAGAADAAAGSATPLIEQAEVNEWAFSATVSMYSVPDDHEYVQPTITADKGWLHLEARYNYEALDTGSLWAGYNFAGGEELTWDLTPMIGGVFGETTGIAPGYEATLSWWKFELYSEGEYVIDTDDSSESFLYNWSELSVSPVECFRFGIVAQRTRLYEGEHDIQRGFLVGFSFDPVDMTAYVFNPDDGSATFVFSVGVSF